MTNEQTYLLLMWIANSLEREMDDLREQLPENTEREIEWWKGNKRAPNLPLQSQEALEMNGYEPRPIGDFVILAGLMDLLEKLENGYLLLRSDET